MTFNEDVDASIDLGPNRLAELVNTHWPVPAPQAGLLTLRKAMKSMAHEQAALDLRLARLLCWFRSHDGHKHLGYSTWLAFVRERVDWSSTWLRDLMRLINSPLNRVKRAANLGLIPLSVATRAPSQTTQKDEADWLMGVMAGRVPRDRTKANKDAREYFEAADWLDVEDHDAKVVHEARMLARLLIGRRVATHKVDRTIIEAWQDGTPAQMLLKKAREAPAPPPQTTPHWDDHDPATSLIGSWEEPATAQIAATKLKELQATRNGRIIALGMGYETIVWNNLHFDMGFDFLEDYVRTDLGLSIRTLQRYRRLGQHLDLFPELAEGAKQGLSLNRIERLTTIVSENSVDQWIALAQRIGVLELSRAIEDACVTSTHQTLDRYDQATDETTNPVALVRHHPPPQPKWLRVHPDLPRASAWFVNEVSVPKQFGTRKVKERDHFTCQNPECGRRTLRVESHHIHWRSHGGSDESENLITLCRGCHLRLLHTHIISMEHHGHKLVWRYPDREVHQMLNL